jgi:hypothetical protein
MHWLKFSQDNHFGCSTCGFDTIDETKTSPQKVGEQFKLWKPPRLGRHQSTETAQD